MTDEDFRDLIEEYDSAEGYGQKLATRKALMDAFRSELSDEFLDKLFFWMVKHHRDGHLKGFKEFARAILSASKETQS